MWPFRTVRVLSIDGGGIRGLIPAMVLQNVKERMRRAGRERPLHACFDLIAGTSTGGLIALGLTVPKPESGEPALSIDEIVRMYREEGTRIFPQWKFKLLHTMSHAFQEKYALENLESFLGPVLADMTLQDALSDLLITSFDVERNTPYLFKKRAGRADDENFLMSDVAKATAAAPSYFEPAVITACGSSGNDYCMVDGAVYANNPAMCAYIEARKLYPWAWRYEILSLGTGRPSRHLTRDDLESWGFVDWVSPMRGAPLFGIISAGQTESVDYQLNKLPGVRYYRVNGRFEGERPEMDDASPENIERLAATAGSFISEHDAMLERVSRRL